MTPRPDCQPRYPGSGRLDGRVALITGGDSGIGRAVAVLFAREGAGIAMAYLDEHEDAAETRRAVEAEGRRCLTIVAFTRSLAQQPVERGIRVNAVAPGPIWTPLIPATFKPERTAQHGSSVPMSRPGQPSEVATCHLFLACEDGSYMTGQVLHPNGGEIVNG